jgi:chromosome segregation ATPase
LEEQAEALQEPAEALEV